MCEGGVDVFSLGDLCADQEQLTVLTDPFWEVLSSNSHRERERERERELPSPETKDHNTPPFTLH